MPQLHLTAASVNKLPLLESGQQLYRDTKLQGFGLRVGSSVKTYFVEKRVDGRNVRHSLGIHGQITADQARDWATIKLGEMTSGKDLNVEKKAKARARVEAEKATKDAPKHTLSALCDWYVKHQRALEKESAGDAENLFKNYVKASAFADVPARDLTEEDATDLLRPLTSEGKMRSAAKLRAYLRAAYALAHGARTDASAPMDLKAFGIRVNPVALTKALSTGNKTRDVFLTETELGETMRLLREHRREGHDDALAAIELSVLLGGQRLAQVLRLEADQVDLEGGMLALWDSKGRRQTPRKHLLPITNSARELLEEILKVRRADWLFGDKNAQTTPDTVARKGGELLQEAQAAAAKRTKSRAARPVVQVRDLRRTAETMLAAMGISKDLRAQIQSHGLGGVQDRHYDRHDYMPEKRRALEAWEAKLNALAECKAPASNVKEIRAAR